MYQLDATLSTHDKLRIQILGQTLKGKALKQFTNESEMAQRAMRTLDFKDIILNLQDRFYRNATVLVTANKFEKLVQGTKDWLMNFSYKPTGWQSRHRIMPYGDGSYRH
jgi:hypothetical protein